MDEFLIDKCAVRRAFSRAASSYDAAAVLQREVCGRMLERLDYVKLQPQRVLDGGSGTGWGGRQVGEHFASAEVVARDIALGMRQAARGRGAEIIPGGEMFVTQGARQFEIWTGKPAPVVEMQQEVHSALEARRLAAPASAKKRKR